MADPISLTLGILGAAGVTAKAATVVRKKLRSFRHYSEEVKRTLKSLKRERILYDNEIHHLLLSALDGDPDHVAEALLEDPTHDGWEDEDLEEGLREALGRSHATVKEVIEEIGSTFRNLMLELERFESLADQSEEETRDTESASGRLRSRTKVAWDKTTWESHLKSLHKSIVVLGRLRRQAQEIKVARTKTMSQSEKRRRTSPEYTHFGTVRSASSDLHRTLEAAWSTEMALNPCQLQHTVKLLLNAQVLEEVRMDLVICCPAQQVIPSNQTKHFKCIRVQSQPQDLDSCELSTSGRRKRRKVHFSDEACSNSMEPQPQTLTSSLVAPHLCTTLCGPSRPFHGPRSIGFIDSPVCSKERFRHSFYGDAKPIAPDAMPVPMAEMLQKSPHASISFVDRLQLACSLVSAVLKFYSTPWLNEYFSLQDIFCFMSSHDSASKFFRTMHVSLDFAQQQTGDDSDSQPVAMEISNSLQEAQLRHDIPNLSLWCLGTILLQIGTWSRLEAPDDVETVRTLAYQDCQLGPKYRELTRKCLRCDFDFGDDLSKERLQQDVYEKVVCELNDMIKILSIAEE